MRCRESPDSLVQRPADRHRARPRVNVLTPALHYGIGVFEGIRCYETDDGPAIFRLNEHIDRLLRSARILGFRDVPYDVDDAQRRDDRDRARQRLRRLLHPPADLSRRTAAGTSTSTAASRTWASPSGSGTPTWATRPGSTACAPTSRRSPGTTPTCMMTKAKVCGQLRELGARQDRVAPPRVRRSDHARPAGLRGRVHRREHLRRQGRRRVHAAVRPPFSTASRGRRSSPLPATSGSACPKPRSAGTCCTPPTRCSCAARPPRSSASAKIDFRTIGRGAVGPVTRALQEAYHAAVRGLIRRVRTEWLAFVDGAAAADRLSADAPAA